MPTALSPERLDSLLDSDREVALLDVRPALDYADGHVRESTPVSRRLLEVRLPELVPNPGVEVVICDREGERGPLDASWLRRIGYGNAAYLEGGMAAWRDAGLPTVEAIDGVPNTAFNFPSKEFGERVHVERGVPSLDPEEAKELLEEEDVLAVDVRTPEEYREWAIPGAVNLEGVELPRRIGALREGDQPVLVNCAGRTRSIIGTATLERMGLENVYELENGTMGWTLAGFDVERGAERDRRDVELDGEEREAVEAFADDLMDEADVPFVSVDEFRRLREGDRTVYAIDVRTAEEYEAEHVEGAIGVQGGQAIQTANQHVAVRNAAIVFVSDTYVRAAITAYWFSEMGFPDVRVLEGGLDAWTDEGLPTESGRSRPEPAGGALLEGVDRIAPAALDGERGDVEVVDVDVSTSFEEGHVPGARWVDRYDLEPTLESEYGDDPVVLTCGPGEYSALAAAAVGAELGREVRVLEGGVEAWREAGLPVEAGPPDAEPRDTYEKPYGDNAAMRAYLEWEEELGEQFA